MSKKIIILELLEYETLILIDRQLNKHVYLLPDWEEPYRSNISKGDEFFIINRTLDTPGIMMYGTIATGVHLFRNYGYDRIVFEEYHDINPLKYRLLSPDVLQKSMPHFSWDIAFPGRSVPDIYADKLHQMWNEYLSMNDDLKDD